MKNLNFKNFNYAMIDSARSGYREVLVTYTVDGQTARKCVFIKEVKGKDKNYYLAQAKKEINASIKDGSLAKSASKQLARGGATKPVLITLSCVLAAGALGTGGYFLGSYLGGNGGNVVTGHTVVLDAGKGTFADDQTYLVLSGIKDGTALGDVKGYTLPAYENWDFDKWEGIDGPGESYKITTDLLLTATYIQGINYTRDVVKTATYNKMQEIIATQPEAQSSVQKIYDSTMKAINDPTLADNKNGIKVVQELQQFALDTMDLIGKNPSIKGIDTIYEADINDLIKTQNDNKRFMLAKIYAAYLKGCSYGAVPVAESVLDFIFEEGIKMINETEDEDLARLYAHTYAGLELAASITKSKEDINRAKEAFIMTVDKVYKKEIIRKGDITTLDWIGEMFYNAMAASTNSQLQQGIYSGLINSYFKDSISKAMEAVATGDAFTLGSANILSYIVKTIANVDIKQKGYWPNESEFGSALDAYIKLYDGCFKDYQVKATSKEKLISMVTEIFRTALDAFVTYPGDNQEDFNALIGTIDESAQPTGFVTAAISYMTESAPLVDFYFNDFFSYLANDLIKIAQNKKDDKKGGNYKLLFSNIMLFYNQLLNSLTDPSCATILKQTLWDIIDLTVDSDYIYEPKSVGTVLDTLCQQLKSNNKDYLTKTFVSAFKGANKMHTDFDVKTSAYYEGFANSITDVIIADLLRDAGTTVTEKFVDFACSTFSDYGVTYFDGCYTSTSDYSASFAKLVNLVNGVLPTISNQIFQASNLPEEIFSSYFEGYNALFEMMPKLVRHDSAPDTAGLIDLFTEFLLQPTECYKAVMDNNKPELADKTILLTNAMKENLINKVTNKTTVEQMKGYTEKTADEMKKIIS